MHGKESEKRGCASHELFIMWSTFLVSGMTTFERPAGVFKLEYCNNCIINKKEFCMHQKPFNSHVCWDSLYSMFKVFYGNTGILL